MSDMVEQTIRQMGENAANAAKEYAEIFDRQQARIEQLERKVERLRGAVKAAYREGFTDADHSGLSEEDLDDEWRECWEISTAKAALQETADGN